jgi:hypothetical protein
MIQSTSSDFLWIPGQGCDPAALARMEQAFARPNYPMGEAWFMSEERRTFPELQGDLAVIPVERLQDTLTHIVSGPICFGVPEEWRDWFHYLLPRLLPRSHECSFDTLLEILLTSLFAHYPEGLEAGPYPGFRDDVLGTAGRCLMDTVCWPSGAFDVEACLGPRFADDSRWGEASGALSASMFLSLKYLRPAEVKPWLESVLAIGEPRWRRQVMLWLLGAHTILTGAIRQPSQLFALCDNPRIDWDWSHCINGTYPDLGGDEIDFIPEANRSVALEATRGHFTKAVFLEWLQSFASEPLLDANLAETSYRFFDLYGGMSAA